MDILELIPFLRRAPEPETPADTLPVITERLNGGSGDPIQVSAAVEQLLSARSSWTAHKQGLEQHLQKLVADGAEEKKRRPIRDAIARASEETKLLEIGEAPLRQRLVKVQADLMHSRKNQGQEVLCAALGPILETLLPLMDRAAPIIARVNRGEINVDPSFIQQVLPGLAWVIRYVGENRAHFESALSAIGREHEAQRPPDAAKVPPRKVRFLSNRKMELDDTTIVELPENNFRASPQKISPPAEPHVGTPQRVHATDSPFAVTSLPAAAAPSPRKLDDLSPLDPGDVRVRVVRSGYETPAGQQCVTGQIVKLPARIASKAIENNAVVAVEMNVDRTKVEGGAWQGADPRESLTILGSGGTAVTQQPDKPPAAASAEQPKEGASKQ
ncbi:MAG TPA: hypothetical protein VHW95_00040 [Steroidobacteraceae bacterium]|jgi:hypothetical protein|nr:hypothetical protein [Steroidobacteraceae bacterium]